ncbi:MAG TPA: hypothetical protein VK638_13115 [Edaphobacter sp.]|nr:hypothetical protein [Edaphobacter sp.]
MRLIVRLAVTMLAVTSSLFCQQPNSQNKGPIQSRSGKILGQVPEVPQTPQEVLLLFAGAKADDHILLTLNNNHVKDLEVTATIYAANGHETVLPSFSLVPRESRIVEMADILHAAGLGSQELGWLKLNYTGVFLGLGAQLTLYGTQQQVGVDSPRSLSTDFKSTSRSAAFLMPEDASARISLTNTSNESVLVNIQCGLFAKSISVSAYSTDIQTISIADLKNQHSFAGEAASCDINFNSAVSALRVAGVIHGKHEYAAPIRFYDPATATFPSLTAVGVDTSSETIAVVHNLTDESIQYTPVIAEATLDEPRKIMLSTEVLQPHTDKAINLSTALQVLKSQGISNSIVTFQTNASKGAFVGALTQIFVRDGLIEDIPFRTANRAGNAAGAYPLRWEKDYTNLVTVTNTSSEPLIARSVITVGDVSYVPQERTIAPGRTAIYDVDQMRKQQIKDVNGKTIPLDFDYGKFMWFDSSLGSKKGLMGRNSVTSILDHRKSSFSCGMDCGFTFDKKPVFDNNPFGFGPFGSSWGGPIVNRTYLSNGQEASSPYSYSSTQLATSNPGVLNYSGDQSVYTAATGLGGAVLASYYEYDQQAAYDIFGDCTPLMTEGPVSGSAGTYPTITYQGQSQVLNGTTQTVAVGQQMALTATYTLPNGASVQSQSWSVSGTTIGSYIASRNSSSANAADFGNQGTTFYWLSPGMNTVTFNLTPNDGSPSVSASVNFNVEGPTSASVNSSTGTPMIQNNDLLTFGDPFGTPGISFSVIATDPQDFSGTYSWVQVITNSSATDTDLSGYTQHCTYGPGLDETYPYSTGFTANDSPNIGLDSNHTEVTDSDAFRMYLMWTPNTSSPTIPVPLGFIDWSWSGDAQRDQSIGNWLLESSSVGPHSFVPSTSFPIWGDYVSPAEGHSVSCH